MNIDQPAALTPSEVECILIRTIDDLLDGLPSDAMREAGLRAIAKKVAVELAYAQPTPIPAARVLEGLARRLRRGACIPV
ncbi:hypothetical protein MKK75_22700 [Methylobacterium sp. J-030]|uniref:hypothetical protein n=1 Tax=Methylobacterium sp. J-030 TaxID=2836627 RepID=UPI001FBA4EB1|nr:hypothetical protein [Methylobacterium sp. J-030]MCJ2071575.1 hypothetical protein [Methylobacterium sp. J-030]